MSETQVKRETGEPSNLDNSNVEVTNNPPTVETNPITKEEVKEDGSTHTETKADAVYEAEAKQETESESKSETISNDHQEMPELVIDPEFKSLIPPLSEGELAALMKSLQEEGCRDKLVTCMLNGRRILLDGHNRYKSCMELGIPFDFVEIKIASRTEAKIWIIKNQRSRRNLDESQRAMLAVTLEALYSEQAKDNMGTRTDLGQKLAHDEGRSAEKAANDMGVSHQTVSFAKKVTTKGIPELAKLVETGDVAVSAAAKVAALKKDVQRKVVADIDAKIKNGEKPNMAAIIRENQELPERDDDELLEKFSKNQDTNLELVGNIECISQPENIVAILATMEKIVEKLREIETKSLVHGQDPASGSVIGVKHFKALIDSIVPINNQIKIKSDGNGMSIITTDYMGKRIVKASLPKEAFARYEVMGEIGLDAAVTQKFLIGKRMSMRINVDRNDNQLCMTYGVHQNKQHLISVDDISTDLALSNLTPACRITVSSKEFLHALESAKNFMVSSKPKKRGSKRIIPDVRFIVKDNELSVVCKTLDNDLMKLTCACKILNQTGEVNSRFNIDDVICLKQTISRNQEVTLGLGMMQPMILDLVADETNVRYIVDTLDAT